MFKFIVVFDLNRRLDLHLVNLPPLLVTVGVEQRLEIHLAPLAVHVQLLIFLNQNAAPLKIDGVDFVRLLLVAGLLEHSQLLDLPLILFILLLLLRKVLLLHEVERHHVLLDFGALLDELAEVDVRLNTQHNHYVNYLREDQDVLDVLRVEVVDDVHQSEADGHAHEEQFEGLEHDLVRCPVDAHDIRLPIEIDFVHAVLVDDPRHEMNCQEHVRDVLCLDRMLSVHWLLGDAQLLLNIQKHLVVEERRNQEQDLELDDGLHVVDDVGILHHIQGIDLVIPLLIKLRLRNVTDDAILQKVRRFIRVQHLIIIIVVIRQSIVYFVKPFLIQFDYDIGTLADINAPPLIQKILHLVLILLICLIFSEKVPNFHWTIVYVEVQWLDVAEPLQQLVDHECHVRLVELYRLVDADLREARLYHQYDQGRDEAGPRHELDEEPFRRQSKVLL